ncbi:MAG: hypothetical protein KC496_03450, partial [Anaerolineae bacterium]|nr:hypothetical protein [Anaerolineae bacterium]
LPRIKIPGYRRPKPTKGVIKVFYSSERFPSVPLVGAQPRVAGRFQRPAQGSKKRTLQKSV